jgi:hypothetical protein
MQTSTPTARYRVERLARGRKRPLWLAVDGATGATLHPFPTQRMAVQYVGLRNTEPGL